MKQALEAARERLAERMKSLEPRRDAWEKQLLAAFRSRRVGVAHQHPLEAKSVNGAGLTIHNDDELEFTTYEGGSLSAFRAKADGLVIAGGPNPDNDTYTVTFRPGAGTWRRSGWSWCRTNSPRHSPGARRGPSGDHRTGSRDGWQADSVPLRAVQLSNQASEHLPIAAFDGDPDTAGRSLHTAKCRK